MPWLRSRNGQIPTLVVDDRTGKPFVLYDVLAGGYGGRLGKDGVEGMMPVANCANTVGKRNRTKRLNDAEQNVPEGYRLRAGITLMI